MKYKVAFLLGSLNRGGTETLVLDVFRHAETCDLNIVGVYRKEGVLSSEYYQSYVPLYHLAPSSAFNIIHYLIHLRKILKQQHVTVVHAQQNIDAFYACIATLFLPIKIVQTYHGFHYGYGRLNKLLERLTIKLSDRNIFVSKEQEKYYVSYYKLSSSKLHTMVYNGIDFEKFAKKSKASIRVELGISHEVLLIVTVGNFVQGRDQLTLCRFAKILADNSIDFRFAFIGKKSDSMPWLFDECIRFVSDNNLSDKVLFLGSRDDVPHILPQCDAFLYSTDHDTFGIAVIEALAVGVPVFVNDWGVMNEITENGKYATLYKTKDEQDLLRHFLLFLQEKPAYLQKAIEASLFVRERYSINKHIEELKKVYSGL